MVNLFQGWAFRSHDVHPKPDFKGHLLGDGFLSCNLTGCFLLKGASIEFVNIVKLLLVLLVLLVYVGQAAQCVFLSSIKRTEYLSCKDVERAAGAAAQCVFPFSIKLIEELMR